MKTQHRFPILFLILLFSITFFFADTVWSRPQMDSNAYTLSGRVYEGDTGLEPPQTAPLQGVTVSLYCSQNHAQQGTFLRSTTTDQDGWYGLTVNDSEVANCEYLNIVETDPPGYTSDGATTVDGDVITANWIEYITPLDGKTLTGNKFWDRSLATDTPTPEPTATATATPTPTPIPTATGQPTVTPTPTVAWTPTPTPPSNCQELLINGDFESGDFAPWDHAGAVELGTGRASAHAAWFGGANNVEGELWQAISIPAGANPITLDFWWLVEAESEQPGDALEVIVQYGDNQTDHLRTLPAVDPRGIWQEVTLDMSAYAGQEVALTFFAHTDADTPSIFQLDDVSLQSCGATTVTSTPPSDYRLYLPLILRQPPSLIFTDDFEDGTLTHWTAHNGVWTNPGGYMQGDNALGNAWNIRDAAGANFFYEGTVTLKNGNAAGLTFRSSADGLSSYDAILDIVDGVFKLSKRPPYQVMASFPMTVQRDRSYRIRVLTRGDKIEAYLDSVKRLEVTDSTYTSGRFGVMLFRATATYDNLRAYALP